MSRSGQSDLLADLQVDLRRPTRDERPAGVVPALELRLTPLHWALPRVRRSAVGWTAAAGPLHAALLLG